MRRPAATAAFMLRFRPMPTPPSACAREWRSAVRAPTPPAPAVPKKHRSVLRLLGGAHQLSVACDLPQVERDHLVSRQTLDHFALDPVVETEFHFNQVHMMV